MTYIATFFSHFGAIRFDTLEKKCNNQSRVMPVPRTLSSSCGTCVRYEAREPWPEGAVRDEVEQIVTVNEQGYDTVYRAEDI